MNSKELRIKFENGEISREVYDFLLQSNRKMRYYSYDIKAERVVKDGEKTIVLPAREDSFERLTELGHEFRTEENTEDAVAKQLLQEQLRLVLAELTAEERRLIHEIFFSKDGKGKTEREVAESLGIPYMTVHDRKVKVLDKLKKLMKL